MGIPGGGPAFPSPMMGPGVSSSSFTARPPFDLVLSEPAFPRVYEVDESYLTQVGYQFCDLKDVSTVCFFF